jgi:glucose/arabinose dehydrogenase
MILGSLAYHPTVGLLILDRDNNRLLRMTPKRFEVILEASGVSNNMDRLTGLTVTSDGTIYVSDHKAGVLARLARRAAE